MLAIDERIWGMSDAELNAFPLGIVRLDRQGTIHLFNAAEEAFVKKHAAEVIGLNYFSQVAPCTAVKDFQGRFEQFVNASGARTEKFGFFYPFAWGHREVLITLSKRSGDDWIYIITDIGPVTDAHSSSSES